MMNERLNELFARRLARTLTPAEKLELCGLLLQPELKQQVSDLVWKAGEDWQAGSKEMSALAKQQLMERIMENAKEEDEISGSIEAPVIEIEQAGSHRAIGRRTALRRRWMVAASTILLLGLGIYFFFINKNDPKPVAPLVYAKDVEAPKLTKATITMADGRKVAVDGLTSVNDGAISVEKNSNGEIVYHGSANNEAYNILDNPAGSPVATITLSDGTKVWLNTASSLKYFATNAGKERRVEVTGEAYFEVAKDKDRPFIVKKDETAVTVLGTHFNVNAYEDEDAIKVTLLEGAVEVQSKNEKVKIKPGEQARVITPGSRPLVNGSIDLEEVMAWKNGSFSFRNATLGEIMRQAARWYDVKVIYEGAMSSERFKGDVKRNTNLSELMKILSLNGVKYRIDGKKVVIFQ